MGVSDVAVELELSVKIEPDLPQVVPGAISFETGASREQVGTAGAFIYEHHGGGWRPSDKGALPAFFEDLILGCPFPPTFATRELRDVDALLAIALFLHRDLATHPTMPALVNEVDFVHRVGFSALAHVPEALARFLCMLRSYLTPQGLTKREFSERLATSVGWLREYVLDERLPHLGPSLSPVRVLEQGTNGFVVAETSGPMIDGWVTLYRQGHLRGMLLRGREGDRKNVLVARKSPYVPLDLPSACAAFNQMESAMGELPEWKVSSDGLWLEGPPGGSLLLGTHLLSVLLRV